VANDSSGGSAFALPKKFSQTARKEGVMEVASEFVPNGSNPLNDRCPQGATLQTVFSFNCGLTTTNLSHSPQSPTLFATEVAPTAGL